MGRSTGRRWRSSDRAMESDHAEDLAMAALDEIEVPRHRLLDLWARAEVRHVMLELLKALDLGLPDDRPVRGDGIDHQPAVSKAVLLLGGRKGRAQLFDEQLRLARLAAKDVADHIHEI